MQRVWLRFRLLATLFVAGCVLVVAAPVAAASSGSNYNVTTSPVYVPLATKPGQAVSAPIKVQNNAAKPVMLNLKLMKFKAYGKDGRAQLLTPSANDPSVKWVSFSQTSLVAQPGVWNTLTMTIHPDRTAAFGYYYAVVFTPEGSNSPAQKVNTVTGSSAVLVLLDVQVPGEKRRLTVSSFKTQHGINEFLPVRFDTVVKNVGDIYGAPIGDVYITRNHKDNVAVLPVNQDEGNVLPSSSRTFSTTWDDGFPAHITKRVGGQIVTGRDGQPETELSWSASKLSSLRFGRYYAHLLLVYNNGTQDVPVEAETSFWVIPWKALGIAVLLLGLIIFGLVTVVRRGIHAGRTVARRRPSKKDKSTKTGA
jgi:hypothetical protein